MGLETLSLVAAANALVGACVGLTGVAGFLLPMFYAGFLGLEPVEGLALSFAAFVVSGTLGCPAYRRTGDLPLRASVGLLAGSFLGALAGTQVGLVLPAEVLTVILYLVVLGSGSSVLLRMRAGEGGGSGADAMPAAGRLFIVGAATAVVCAASGAGGPVLVVPVLMLMGVGPRGAVGMSLLDSVAIAVPATVGYLLGGGRRRRRVGPAPGCARRTRRGGPARQPQRAPNQRPAAQDHRFSGLDRRCAHKARPARACVGAGVGQNRTVGGVVGGSRLRRGQGRGLRAGRARAT